MSRSLALALVLAPWALPFACAPEPAALVLSVEGGRLQARRPDGSRLTGEALLGTELTVRNHLDVEARVRIDAVRPDPLAPHGPLAFYEVSRWDAAADAWVSYCEPGPDGSTLALPLPGRWRDGGVSFVEDPHDFTLTCTAGANGKCARMGYVPGRLTEAGESLTPYFVTCVRMMRADYCGDGRSYTAAGVPVDLLDRAGRQPQWQRRDMAFEAAWGPQGAVCVRRPRDASHTTLPALVERCPRLADAVGEPCREDAITTHPEVLLVNRSPEPTTDPA